MLYTETFKARMVRRTEPVNDFETAGAFV